MTAAELLDAIAVPLAADPSFPPGWFAAFLERQRPLFEDTIGRYLLPLLAPPLAALPPAELPPAELPSAEILKAAGYPFVQEEGRCRVERGPGHQPCSVSSNSSTIACRP